MKILLTFILLALTHSTALAGGDCGNPFENSLSFAPIDYANPVSRAAQLGNVERLHLTPEMYRNAVTGKYDFDVAAHLDYVLRASPNHHRALYAMSMYQIKMRGSNVGESLRVVKRFHNIECYFDRAMRFNPNDPGVYGTYGIVMYSDGKPTEALPLLEKAVEMGGETAEIHYTFGLIFLKTNRLEEAFEHAQKAYKIGYPFTYLRTELEKQGAWRGE